MSDQGPAPRINTGRLREPLFTTVKRGYDPKQVLEYLSGVADDLDTLQSRTRQLESDLAEARDKKDRAVLSQVAGADPYEGLSAHVVTVMRTFDHDVEGRREDTKMESDRILAEARAEADRIRSDAQGSAEEARAVAERTSQEAREETARALSHLVSRREAMLDELRAIRDRMLDATKNLEAAIDEAPAHHVLVVGDAGDGERAITSSFTSRAGGPEPGL